MNDFLRTLLIAVIPAIITSLGAYFIAAKNFRTSIETLEETNRHDIDRLMEQHKLDIDALKEKHRMDLESKEKGHTYKLEIMQKEHENELIKNSKSNENQVMFGALGGFFQEVIKDPTKLDDLMKLKEKTEQFKKKK